MLRWASIDSRSVVVDRAGGQVVLGHPEALLDAPQLVVGVDDELRGHAGEVGGVALPPASARVLASSSRLTLLVAR